MKRMIVAMALAAPLAVPMAAFAADTPDASFYKNAAEGGIAEVEAGNLAESKTQNAKLKDFAAMMVKDHTAANDKLKGIADGKGIKLPTSSSIGQMASKTKLEVLSGDTFDKSYIKGQIKAHMDTAALFKKEIATGKDPEAKAFAKATLPTVQTHLKEIKAIAMEAGVKTS